MAFRVRLSRSASSRLIGASPASVGQHSSAQLAGSGGRELRVVVAVIVEHQYRQGSISELPWSASRVLMTVDIGGKDVRTAAASDRDRGGAGGAPRGGAPSLARSRAPGARTPR